MLEKSYDAYIIVLKQIYKRNKKTTKKIAGCLCFVNKSILRNNICNHTTRETFAKKKEKLLIIILIRNA